MLNVDTIFYLLAGKFKLEPDVQIALLLGFIQEKVPDTFLSWLEEINDELEKPVEQEPEVPVTHTDEQTAFFDRDLTLQHTTNLVQELAVETLGPDKGGNIVVSIRPDTEYLQALGDIVSDGRTVLDYPYNGLLGGWFYEFDDGAVAMIMVMNGDQAGKPYVDAVLVPPDEYRDVPSISLEPRYKIEGDYVFDYPDGSTVTLELLDATG
jgi:hypothetical protein